MTADQLAALKALCREGETPEEHGQHAEQLEAAYFAFAAESNGGVILAPPTQPGVTNIAADITIATEMS